MDYTQYRLADLRSKTNAANYYPFDIMITGVTGAGKSTTLNKLFGRQVASEGVGDPPEHGRQVPLG